MAVAGVALVGGAILIASSGDDTTTTTANASPPSPPKRRPGEATAFTMRQPIETSRTDAGLPGERATDPNGEPATPALPVPALPLPELEGSGPKFPSNLDPRFREDALKQSITKAIADMGMDGEVTSVDCDEHPCLVVAKVRGNVDAYSLRQLPSMKTYERDNIWFHAGPAIGEARTIVVGWTPPGDTSATKSRMRIRQQRGIASVPADALKEFFRRP